MQALGGQRRMQGLGDAFGGRGGIEARRAVAEVEGEGAGRERRVGAHLDRAGIADRLGGLLEHGLQTVGELGVGGEDQAGRGLDLAGQGLQGGAHRRLRELVEGGGGDRLGAGQRQLGGTDPVGMGDLGQPRQGFAAGGRDHRQRLGLAVGDVGERPGFALGRGGLADRLDLLGGIVPLGAGRGVDHLAGRLEDRAEEEFLMREGRRS